MSPDTKSREYDVVTISSEPVATSERIPLRSEMGRDLLITRLVGEPSLTIANVHLESTSTMTDVRVAQLEQVTAVLANETDVILIGDMNFDARTDSPEHRPLAGWTDAWALLRPDQPGFTVDTHINHMRHMAKQNRHHQQRIDRVLIRSGRWRVESSRSSCFRYSFIAARERGSTDRWVPVTRTSACHHRTWLRTPRRCHRRRRSSACTSR